MVTRENQKFFFLLNDSSLFGIELFIYLNRNMDKIIKYIKRLINKYVDKNELKERLILNHIISLSNVFGVEAAVNMLRFKIDIKNHDVLNAFLVYLDYVKLEDVKVLDLALYNKLKKSI